MDADDQLLNDLFDSLRSSSDTYQEVMMKIQDGTKEKTRIGSKAAIAALAITLGCSATAFAVVAGSGLLSGAFDGNGQEDVEAHEVVYSYKPGGHTAPAMQWTAVSEETVREIIGAHAQAVGFTVTRDDATVTIDDVVFDENGLGVATFTIVDPAGFDGLWDAGYGRVDFKPPMSIGGVGVSAAEDQNADGADAPKLSYDCRVVLDKSRSTETELHCVLYFVPFGHIDPLAPVVWSVSGGSADWSEKSDPFQPTSCASAVRLEADGFSGSISPLGLRLEGPVGESWIRALAQEARNEEGTIGAAIEAYGGVSTADMAQIEVVETDGTIIVFDIQDEDDAMGFLAYGKESPSLESVKITMLDGTVLEGRCVPVAEQQRRWLISRIVVTFEDGSEYVVRDEDLINWVVSCITEDGGQNYAFNRLINASQVASVTINGPDGEEDVVFRPAE